MDYMIYILFVPFTPMFLRGNKATTEHSHALVPPNTLAF